jgi:hypothetical protein
LAKRKTMPDKTVAGKKAPAQTARANGRVHWNPRQRSRDCNREIWSATQTLSAVQITGQTGQVTHIW